ncbi:MAG: 30S ribosomal protein S20 [Clostridia bacterium]|nr:30S ribosomal protein S20 [Clostridia bacterium]
MPNIKSAKKRVLVTEKKTLENKAMRSKMRNAIKKFNDCIDTLKLDEAEKMLPALMSTIDEAASNGIIHKSNADNKKSRLSARLSGVKSGKIIVNIKKDNKTIAAEKAQAAREKAEAIRAENLKKMQERAAAKEAEKRAKEEAAAAAKKAKEEAEKAAKKAKRAKKEA